MKQVAATAAIAAVIITAGAALAETPPPYPDFTFRRVKPPASQAEKRITVQIAPQVVVPDLPPVVHIPDTPFTPGGPVGSLAWYWDVVSPAMTDSGPGRLAPAVEALRNGPGGSNVPAPRLQMMQNLATAYRAEILKATIGTRVSPALVLAVMGVESGGRANAVSPKGATGLMQLMPATAERFGVTDISDPAQNIRGGVAYLDWLMKEFERDPILVLAGYNAGEGAVKGNNGVPPYAETRDYVPKVLAAWAVARSLCATPPELITDGCALNIPGQ
ncbi:lytic transglycosylase domain-containing protein [Actibacterium sp. XHP0104]|uniref:lytic transglycosylase domain-containing protein n=1 Tax=Actibacterium sp. XHP0104 TaxID=2984335 RepID=UPI0021E902EF|nr:lytic transglycosylase domain-containing protein [Actibacterium sp. XHP0104]MCV2880522.1 lytic transglycosylase domain-containing protein [Actibacterium sp. XHP0104]